ncbi:Protein kinase domain [Carpediemonas membranifera]|uniref:non-specific serine/threonine protein kinase n=1 Tax=Carpediemonas membranifera TaxID=201153 RepID=A0A8J6E2A9_9EUKA|nr:Protein kinase domain [Carpediemonas membranifera]|eukprot:KAG9391687.1 Protein kinase domain [Carpediemonas membranifera]
MPSVEGKIILNGSYQLGKEIGRGGYGSVYRAIDISNNPTCGTTVAIKALNIKGMDKEEQRATMMEIDLLSKLHHTNIVQYVQSDVESDTLYIVMEYIENGPITSMVKDVHKAGAQVPENAVARYVYRTLVGLAYLHSEGVIHRDIKGANILMTKDGIPKLADFGVSIASDDASAEEIDVVGTPYWMAPEVIEMTGLSTASDIWSLGSTVVELFTGSPPYFEMAPMPAMYRIVQDDCPPLPPQISVLCKNFLMKTFQKDPNLRQSAKQLLKDPWFALFCRDEVETTRLKAFADDGDVDADMELIMPAPSKGPKLIQLGSTDALKASTTTAEQKLTMFGDDDDDADFDDFAESDAFESESDDDKPLKLSLPAAKPATADDDDDFSAFDEVVDPEEAARVAAEEYAVLQLRKEAEECIASMCTAEGTATASTRLLELLDTRPQLISEVPQRVGLMVLVDMLEFHADSKQGRRAKSDPHADVARVLMIINALCKEASVMKGLVLVGALSPLLSFSKSPSPQVRIEVITFLRLMVGLIPGHDSAMEQRQSVQALYSSGGVAALVQLLGIPKNPSNGDLFVAVTALHFINELFSITQDVRRADLVRLLAKHVTPVPLVGLLTSITTLDSGRLKEVATRYAALAKKPEPPAVAQESESSEGWSSTDEDEGEAPDAEPQSTEPAPETPVDLFAVSDTILGLLTSLSQTNDAVVLGALARREVITTLVSVVDGKGLIPSQLLELLRVFRQMSVTRFQPLLTALADCGAIEAIVPLLSEQTIDCYNRTYPECVPAPAQTVWNHIVFILYYTCKLNPDRLSLAAMHGLYSYLAVIATSSRVAVKEFALPMLFEIPRLLDNPKQRARINLGEMSPSVLFELLRDPTRCTHALDALVAWCRAGGKKGKENAVRTHILKDSTFTTSDGDTSALGLIIGVSKLLETQGERYIKYMATSGELLRLDADIRNKVIQHNNFEFVRMLVRTLLEGKVPITAQNEVSKILSLVFVQSDDLLELGHSKVLGFRPQLESIVKESKSIFVKKRVEKILESLPLATAYP